MSNFTTSLSSDPWIPQRPNLDTDIGQIGALSADTVHQAQVEVCSRAADVAEARELLLMLGLGGAS